jgi:hypothetical protein
MERIIMKHIEFMRRQYSYNLKQVLWLTKMSEELWKQLVFEQGIKWLTLHTGETGERLRVLLSQPTVWDWWLNNWRIMDSETFLPALYHVPAAERAVRYREMHEDKQIRATPYYNELVSYSKAVGQLTNDFVKEANI